jgi:hypothetical protein
MLAGNDNVMPIISPDVSDAGHVAGISHQPVM